jgi:hypothetical protein
VWSAPEHVRPPSLNTGAAMLMPDTIGPYPRLSSFFSADCENRKWVRPENGGGFGPRSPIAILRPDLPSPSPADPLDRGPPFLSSRVDPRRGRDCERETRSLIMGVLAPTVLTGCAGAAAGIGSICNAGASQEPGPLRPARAVAGVHAAVTFSCVFARGTYVLRSGATRSRGIWR